jgi:hypothetical protein
MEKYPIENIQPIEPILQQQKSSIITNPFISDTTKIAELNDIQKHANEIFEQQYNKNITNSIQNLSLSDINKNITNSCVGLLDDALNKPSDIHWFQYIQIILKKDQRYAYIGIVLIIIALFILILTN